MKRFNYFHIPLLSFHSRNLYREVAHIWKGTGFLWLALIVFVTTLPSCMVYKASFSNLLDKQGEHVLAQVPAVTIEKGELAIDRPSPHAITIKGEEQPLVLIDTSGQTESLSGCDAAILVTRDNVFFRQGEAQPTTKAISDFNDIQFDADDVKRWANKTESWIMPVIYPAFSALSSVGRIIQALCFAAIGLGIAAWQQVHLSYKQLLRITAIALTPCIILETALALFQVQLPYQGVLSFILAMGYITFGVTSARAN